MCRNTLINQLKKHFNFGNARLPKNIDFKLQHNKLIIIINLPNNNMQTDDNSFESWAFAFYSAGFDNIHVSWKRNLESQDDLHYNRFLYRLSKLKEIFTYFSCDPFDINYIHKSTDTLYINHGISTVNTTNSPNRKEATFESNLYTSDKFRKQFNIDHKMIARQLPVGIFKRDSQINSKLKLKKSEALFTGKNSAIDLCAVDKNNNLNIFELKIDGNKGIGAISELFYYSCILNDIRKGLIKPTSNKTIRDSLLTWNNIINSANTNNYIISSGPIHPIVMQLSSCSKINEIFPFRCIENFICE